MICEGVTSVEGTGQTLAQYLVHKICQCLSGEDTSWIISSFLNLLQRMKLSRGEVDEGIQSRRSCDVVLWQERAVAEGEGRRTQR